MSRNTFKKHVDLLLLEEKGKWYYVLIKHYNTFMYNHTLHRGRKIFCCYCLQAFSTEEILKYFLRGRQLLFMFYADFENVLGNGKQNKNESYINKYQKHVACFKNSTKCRFQ